MSDLEHNLLALLTETKNIARAVELKLPAEVFVEPICGHAYQWVVDYWRESGKAPSRTVMDVEFPSITLPEDAADNFNVDWLGDTLKRRWLTNRLQLLMLDAAKTSDEDPEGSLATLIEDAKATLAKAPLLGGEKGRQITWRTASQIHDRRPEWAWTHNGGGRLPRSALSLFAARPSQGKSTAARWFAAGYSNGTIEGCFYGNPQNVAYIASEESLDAMVKPSLRAVQADMDRIHFPKVEVDGQQVRLLSILDEARLTADFTERGITVVIVDPVMSSIGGKVDINRNNETREYIEPWARMAEAINGLVIGIVHLIKVPGGDIVAAINGSSAFGEVPRAVIAFAKDPQSDDGLCVLSQEKNNAGQTDLALAYTIESATVQTDDLLSSQVGRFVLGGPSDRRVADVLSAHNAADRLGPRSFDVLEAVRQGPGSVDIPTVAKRTGMDPAEVGKYLRRLVKNNLVLHPGRGVYDWPGRLRQNLEQAVS